MPSKIVIQPGDRFGRLTIIEELPSLYRTRPNGYQAAQRVIRASCECGNEVVTEFRNLRSGNTISCGCATRYKKQHGCSYRPEYRVWQSMKSRCENPNVKHYDRYGGRGITVCDRWKDSFENFIADMGDRPSDKHSLDRIDNDGNYEPANCRWATHQQQSRNTRNNRFCEFRGQRRCLSEWAEMAGRVKQCLVVLKTEDKVRARLEKWVEEGILVID